MNGINKLLGFGLLLVAVNAQAARLQDNGDGTVTDFDTGLMWQQSDDNTTRTWADAETYCAGLSLAGKTDWRLPEAKELTSIVDYRYANPAINATAFPGTNASYYWSASSFAANSTDAWRVSFVNGSIYPFNKTSSYYVRCVR